MPVYLHKFVIFGNRQIYFQINRCVQYHFQKLYQKHADIFVNIVILMMASREQISIRHPSITGRSQYWKIDSCHVCKGIFDTSSYYFIKKEGSFTLNTEVYFYIIINEIIKVYVICYGHMMLTPR